VLLFGSFLNALTSLAWACICRGFLHFSLFLIRRFTDFDSVESASTTADGDIANGRTATPLIASTRAGERAVARTRFWTSYYSIGFISLEKKEKRTVKKKKYLRWRFRR
jgi:hypothetical protein